MHQYIRTAGHLGVIVLLLGTIAGVTPSITPVIAQESTLLTGIQLRREGNLLQLYFLANGPLTYQVVANPRRQVAVVKFVGAITAFPDGQRAFAFNDPLVEGILFESIDAETTWAKVRLRTPQVILERVAESPVATAVVALREVPRPTGIRLLGVGLSQPGDRSRLVLDLEQLPVYRIEPQGDLYVVRLAGVVPDPGLTITAEDDQIEVLDAELEGPDTLLRIQTKQPAVPSASVLTDPARLVIDFVPATGPAAEALAEARAGRTAGGGVAARGRAEQLDQPTRQPPAPEPLEELLEEQPNPAIRANYLRGEREFRDEEFRNAAQLFQRVHLATPTSRLGIRALFRAADSAYQLLLLRGATNLHSVIASYQSAIRAAERAGYESELIPRALFNIGRAYQHMELFVESDVHFEILQDAFPDSLPYAVDSYFYRGQSLTGMDRYDEAISQYQAFLDEGGEPALEGPAFYHIGEAYYAKGDFTAAKVAFDQGRRIAPTFADSRPLFLFEMGETYYENAEFEAARELYRQLLANFPDRPYTKLVALRMGDFLREEGKEADALAAYRQVVAGARLPIRLRGLMRIADIFAERPAGDDYREALRLYDEVAEEGSGELIGQEAILRKALTLTLHNQYEEAVAVFEKLAQRYPESPYLLPNVVDASIEENLKGLVDKYARTGADWEVVKVYNKYNDSYLSGFRFKTTLFQIASAYHELGLYEEALVIYQGLARAEPFSQQGLVQYRIAELYSDRDELDRAEEVLDAFIANLPQDPYHTDARMLLGGVYTRARRYDDAITVYQSIVQDFEQAQAPALGEAVPKAYFELGQIYKELGRRKEALDAFIAAVDDFRHPLQGSYVPEDLILSQFQQGEMLYEMGEDIRAKRAYEDFIAHYPDHERTPWAWYQIGLISRRQGNDVEALEIFNRLVALAEEQPGEIWEELARDNQRDLANVLQYREYLSQ